jgi:thioredoxin 1
MQTTLIITVMILAIIGTLYLLVRYRMMAPVLNEVASELPGNSFVGKINIEQYQSLAQKFYVRNIPTMVLFKNGKEVNRFVGVKTKDYLIQNIRKA